MATDWVANLVNNIKAGRKLDYDDYRQVQSVLAARGAGNQADALRRLEQSGMLSVLGPDASTLLPDLVHLAYASNSDQCRGLLFAVSGDGLSAAKASRAKRSRSNASVAAAGDFCDGSGFPNDTTFSPAAPNCPTLAIRTCTKHRYPAGAKLQYDELVRQHNALPTADKAGRSRLRAQMYMLSDSHWSLTEAVRVLRQPAGKQQHLPIVCVTLEGTGESRLAWLHLAAAPAKDSIKAGRAVVEVVGTGVPALDGWRKVPVAPRTDGLAAGAACRVGFRPMPALEAAPSSLSPAAQLRISVGLESNTIQYYLTPISQAQVAAAPVRAASAAAEPAGIPGAVDSELGGSGGGGGGDVLMRGAGGPETYNADDIIEGLLRDGQPNPVGRYGTLTVGTGTAQVTKSSPAAPPRRCRRETPPAPPLTPLRPDRPVHPHRAVPIPPGRAAARRPGARRAWLGRLPLGRVRRRRTAPAVGRAAEGRRAVAPRRTGPGGTPARGGVWLGGRPLWPPYVRLPGTGGGEGTAPGGCVRAAARPARWSP